MEIIVAAKGVCTYTSQVLMEKSLCQMGCLVMIEAAIVCSQTCTRSL